MKFNLLLASLFIPLMLGAQQLITIEDAIGAALKNNYGILLSRNAADVNQRNNTAGNAGMLPTIGASGSGNFSVNDVNQDLAGGGSTSYNPLKSSTMNAGIELNWKLFDGGRMFLEKSRLKEMAALGEIQYHESVLQTLYEVISAYYDVVRQKQQLASVKEMMNYNNERVIIAQAGVNAGSMVRTDLLQAQIDLNMMKENLINQQYAILTAKRSLALLLARDPALDFEVTEVIPHDSLPDKQQLLQRLDTVNTTILAWQKELDIARLASKETKAAYLPGLSFRGGYYAAGTDNSAGNIKRNSSLGPQAGATLTIPLFNAGETRRKVAIAKLDEEAAEYNLEAVKWSVARDLHDAFTNYENQLEVLKIERENNQLARENLEISIQRLRLGQTTTLEVHQAEENLVQSSTRLINFEYSLKVSEIKLRQLLSSL